MLSFSYLLTCMFVFFLGTLESTNNSNIGDSLKVNQLWALATLKGWKMNGIQGEINELSESIFIL